jgi:hypothetical protein
LPGDTSVDVCVLPYYFSSLGAAYSGYIFQNSSFTTVATATVSDTYYGIYYTGGNCNDTVILNFTTTGPNITGLSLVYPTCTNAPNGGVIQVSGINGTDSVAYVVGPAFTGAAFTLADSLPTPSTLTNLSGGTYTIRIKRPPFDCYYDTTIVLNYINCPPNATDDTYGIMGGTTINSDVASNDDEPDGDLATFAMIGAPPSGTLVFNSDGTFTYDPVSFRGTTTFFYTMCDDRNPSLCDTALVTITVVSPLPVEMGTFISSEQNNGLLLKWTTLGEKNNNYFELEHGSDAEHYSLMTKIAGHGTTNIPQSYQYFDATPINGLNYYRLKQIDFDGRTTIAGTVIQKFGNLPNDKVEIYPNPNNGTFRLKINCQTEGTTKISIVSLYGNTIYETSVFCTGESIINEIKIKKMAKGMYYLLIKSNDQTEKYKFTVN